MNTESDHRHDGIYLAVGKAVLDFALLEFVVHRVAWAGLSPTDQEAARSQTEKMQFGAVLNSIRRSVREGNYERFIPGINDEVLRFVEDCKRAADERNRLTHSYQDEDRLGRVRDALRSRQPLLATTELIDLSYVEALPEEFDRLRQRAVSIWLSVERAAHQAD